MFTVWMFRWDVKWSFYIAVNGFSLASHVSYVCSCILGDLRLFLSNTFVFNWVIVIDSESSNLSKQFVSSVAQLVDTGFHQLLHCLCTYSYWFFSGHYLLVNIAGSLEMNLIFTDFAVSSCQKLHGEYYFFEDRFNIFNKYQFRWKETM